MVLVSLKENLKTGKIAGTFLDSSKNPSFEESDAVMLGIAFDATASYNSGSWFGPAAILDASQQLEWETPLFGIPLNEKIKVHSMGILEYPRRIENKKWLDWENEKTEKLAKEMISDVKQLAEKVLRHKKFLVCLGGEHSASVGVFEAICQTHNPKEVTIIQLDAHLDLRDSLHGIGNSHAAVMMRALDLGFKTIQIGIRDCISKEEEKTIRENRLEKTIFPSPLMPHPFYFNRSGLFPEPNFLRNGFFSLEAIDRILNQINTPFAYLSIDVDCFDPAFFPGTGTPLPKGLDFASTLDFLYRLFAHLKKKDIRLLGFDVMEVCPQLEKGSEEYDSLAAFSVQTETNAAFLAYSLLFWNFLERFQK